MILVTYGNSLLAHVWTWTISKVIMFNKLWFVVQLMDCVLLAGEKYKLFKHS